MGTECAIANFMASLKMFQNENTCCQLGSSSERKKHSIRDPK